ncbi:hypothetical protein [Nocardiopsis sp. NPDC057823]|uniref:hypothetical protein n=1 Tax=Nocardiopsis sp. NPDC057823 TaxID=3346256 RepID=UPI0036719391
MTARPIAENFGHWWVYAAPEYSELHAMPTTAVDPDNPDTVEAFRSEGITAAAVCETTDTWWWPGIISRLYRDRCTACCDRLGIPPGKGAPVNDDTSHTRKDTTA